MNGASSSLPRWGRAGVGATIANALQVCAGPIVLISNELALDAVAAGQDLRAFLESLGGMNQEAAAACERVTLMSAGQALILKGSS